MTDMTYNFCSAPVQKIHEKRQIRNPRYVCGAGEERPEQSGETVLAHSNLRGGTRRTWQWSLVRTNSMETSRH